MGAFCCSMVPNIRSSAGQICHERLDSAVQVSKTVGRESTADLNFTERSEFAVKDLNSVRPQSLSLSANDCTAASHSGLSHEQDRNKNILPKRSLRVYIPANPEIPPKPVALNDQAKNYFDLHSLLVYPGTNCLRRAWKDSWVLFSGFPWDDTKTVHQHYEDKSCGEYLISILSRKSRDNAFHGSLQKIKDCDTGEWDITLLGTAMTHILKLDEQNQKKNRKFDDERRHRIETLATKLKNRRNEVLHMAKPLLPYKKFSLAWNEVFHLLVQNGEDPAECEAIRGEPAERENAARKLYLQTLLSDHGAWIEEVTSAKYCIDRCIFLDVCQHKLQTPLPRYAPPALETVLPSDPGDELRYCMAANEILLDKTQPGNFLVIGPAGSGKTFTLKMLVNCLYDICRRAEDSPLPIYVSISDIACIIAENKFISAYGLMESIIADRTYTHDQVRNYALDLLKKGKLIVLADGLEQIGKNIELILEILFKLREIVEKIIITSRCAAVHNTLDSFIKNSFHVVFMEPLTKEQQEALVSSRFTRHNHKHAVVRSHMSMITSSRHRAGIPGQAPGTRECEEELFAKPIDVPGDLVTDTLHKIEANGQKEQHRSTHQFLKESEHFADIKKSPALLSLLIEMYLKNADILSNKEYIFQECVRFLLQRGMQVEKRRRAAAVNLDQELEKELKAILSPDFEEFLWAAGYHLWDQRESCLSPTIFQNFFRDQITKQVECWRSLISTDCGVLDARLCNNTPNDFEPESRKVLKTVFLDYLAACFICSEKNRNCDLLLSLFTASDKEEEHLSWRHRALSFVACKLDDPAFEQVCFRLAEISKENQFIEAAMKRFILDRFQNEERAIDMFGFVMAKQALQSFHKEREEMFDVKSTHQLKADEQQNITLNQSEVIKPSGGAISFLVGTVTVPDESNSTDALKELQERERQRAEEVKRMEAIVNEKEEKLKVWTKKSLELEGRVQGLNSNVSQLQRQLKDSETEASRYKAEAKRAKDAVANLEAQIHQRKKIISDPEYFTCSSCPRKFYVSKYENVGAAKHACNQHQQTCEETDEDEDGSWKCWTCHKCFSTRRGMFAHKNRKH